MKVTFTISNLSEEFYEGFGSTIKGLNHMEPLEAFERLNKCSKDMKRNVKIKIGNNSFRDRVDFNGMIKKNPKVEWSLGKRRGYMLATFIFGE